MKRLIFLLMMLAFLQTYAAPKYFRLSFNDDPATTMVLGWSGDISRVSADYEIYFDDEDHGTNTALYPTVLAPSRETQQAGMKHFFYKFSGLTPKTVYYFVVKDKSDGQISARYSFLTLSDNENDALSFVSGGDTREALGGGAQEPFGKCHPKGCRFMRKQGNKVISKIRPDVIYFNGDYVYSLNPVKSEWEEWFEDWQLTIAPDGRMFPMVVSLGNHEQNDVVSNLFNVVNDNLYFGINFNGNLFRLYTLNTENNLSQGGTICGEQKTWLESQLQLYNSPGNDVIWNIVQYHIPMYPQGYYSKNNTIINCWLPLFEQYKVRLALESHTHIYKVTFPILKSSNTADPTYFDGFVRNDGEGITYIGEGNWGAPFRTINARYKWSREVSKDFCSFFFVTVSKDKMEIRTVVFPDDDTKFNAIETLTDNQLGSCLPNGVQLYDASMGAANGPVVELCPNGTGCVGTASPCSTVTGVINNTANDIKKFADIFPNPASDKLNIVFTDKIPEGSIEIYNAFGHLCLSNAIDNQNMSVNIESLCNGVNFLFIRTEEGVQSHKIIKQ